MYVLPDKVKKPTKFLLFLNGIKPLVVFIIINLLFFFGFFVMNSFIGLLYIVFIFLLSVVLTVPSLKNPDKMFLETIILQLLKRKEFDSNEKTFKERIKRARENFAETETKRKKQKNKKIKF